MAPNQMATSCGGESMSGVVSLKTPPSHRPESVRVRVRGLKLSLGANGKSTWLSLAFNLTHMATVLVKNK